MTSRMRVFLSQLDWKTKASKAGIQSHWRLYLCLVIGDALCTFLWYSQYPDIFWFLTLWCGMTTGTIISIVPGLIWQLYSPSRRSTTSGRAVVGQICSSFLFASVAIFFLAPMARIHESERATFRAISSKKVTAIAVFEARRNVTVSQPAIIENFLAATKESELFYPSHEIASREFHLYFQYKDGGSAEFSAWVPERHPDDIVVNMDSARMLLRGGGIWLDAAMKQSTTTPAIR